MRRVGERPRVAAVVDVSEMSQYMPSTAMSSEMPSSIDGTDAQAGRPVWRSAQLPKRLSTPMRPLRWPVIRR